MGRFNNYMDGEAIFLFQCPAVHIKKHSVTQPVRAYKIEAVSFWYVPYILPRHYPIPGISLNFDTASAAGRFYAPLLTGGTEPETYPEYGSLFPR
jgi:hypothetical protein